MTKKKAASKKRVRKKYCANAIIIRGRGYLFIEYLIEPRGIALVGGKRKKGESPLDCIKREGWQETGTEFSVHRVLGIFDEPGLGSRDNCSSTVFVVSAFGKLREEEGKTRIFPLTEKEAQERKNEFVFGHYQIFEYFLNGGGTVAKENV
ncbi:MAG: hypothetical protein G01um101448_347 [Parcubacteria group bacterium Gr01-1014_48]|nr:MAG: hypothetical protein Greene041614_1151 [Parcubacteria group bacterium Greene0416_14]TSC74107.1 MAG: hypothetical protein G01um101448_347 [Parcubacteria group bacterium Gr01-1014_48]TSC99932.1 MAG: hypothetical protein Greene101415_1027 [Parcubacteria group bacterium Greene1014_15]TSD07702.1 MAG: hypothetical protein Greene07144_796 [Parcubacteria group bacterium Greene0714_4]